jgi:hypothetical protein
MRFLRLLLERLRAWDILNRPLDLGCTMSIKILHKKNRLHPIINGHPWGASRRDPMDQIWDLVAGTFIAVSVFTGMAFIIVSAIH